MPPPGEGINEAIREGCKNTVQIFNRLKDDHGGCCVIGALYRGLLRPNGLDNPWDHHKEWGFLCQATNAPCGCTYGNIGNGFQGPIRTIIDVMVHLNNAHQWTREAIAEWVDPRPDLHVRLPGLTTQEVSCGNA